MEKNISNMRAYRYRIYPSKKQLKKLDSQIALCKELYNLLLQRRKEDYQTSKNPINRKTLYKLVKQFKGNDNRYSTIHSQVLQNVADRLAKAYKNYFRRIKEKKAGKKVKAGFPRFKKFYSSITYPQSGFALDTNRLSASRIGNIRIVTERLPKGRIKTLTIKRKPSGKWFVFFGSIVDIPKTTNPNKTNKIGIDLGMENFATLSNGTIIENPRFLRKSEDRLVKYQRRLSNKLKGSANRIKAKIRVARIHEKITNQRTDFLHKTSKMLAEKYNLIALEKLNIMGMLHNHNLARSISDASWKQFTRMIGYKAESAGCQLVFVDPINTSQTCSGCGNMVRKELSDRWHECSCGLSLHRDHNSALEILKRATDGLSGSNAFGDLTDTLLNNKASKINESGTTRVEIDAGNSAL